MRLFVSAIVALSLSGAAAPAAPALRSGDELRRELLGVLVHTRVSVDFDETPVRAALERLSQTLGLPIIGRFADDPAGHGLDPEATITLRYEGGCAWDVLEMILDQATLYEACTWQLGKGFIEVGTKRRLSASSYRHLYPMDDLLLEPPYFGGGVDLGQFENHPFRSASLKTGRGADLLRAQPQQLMDALIRAIAEVVEPANWDFELMMPPPGRSGRGPYRSSDNRVARVRRWRQQTLIIDAPGFFHRQIGGYGPPPVPGPEMPGTRPTGEAFKRRAFAALLDTRLTISFDETPVREATAALQDRLDLPIVGRFDDDRLGYGIDPRIEITLAVTDVPTLNVLESLLDACGTPEETCTWQIRRGYVEVGTKGRLGVPAARELRLYHIRDLMLDIPDSPFAARKLPAGLALDVVEAVVKTVEPGAWDYGQFDYYAEDEPTGGPAVDDRPSGERSRPSARPAGSPRPRPRYIEIRKPAIIRHWRDVLIVHAPPYIHRQLGGARRP